MAKRRNAATDSGRKARGKGAPVSPFVRGDEEDCRCKEMSKKTPHELLKVMIGDLSFWKKKK